MKTYRCIAPLLACLAVGSFLLTTGQAAQANPISIQVAPAGLPLPSNSVTPLNLPNYDVGQTSFKLDQGSPGGSVVVNVNTSRQQGVVSGSSAGLYAAPVTGGSAGSPTYWMAPYFSTGSGGTITLTFSHAQRYLGLLWGSLDYGSTYNYITFNNVSSAGTKLVETITGNDIVAAMGGSAPDGSQGIDGSFYILLNDLTGTFNEVVLGSSVVSFESADLQYAESNIVVPEPASVVLLGSALLGLVAVLRRRGSV